MAEMKSEGPLGQYSTTSGDPARHPNPAEGETEVLVFTGKKRSEPRPLADPAFAEAPTASARILPSPSPNPAPAPVPAPEPARKSVLPSGKGNRKAAPIPAQAAAPASRLVSSVVAPEPVKRKVSPSRADEGSTLEALRRRLDLLTYGGLAALVFLGGGLVYLGSKPKADRAKGANDTSETGAGAPDSSAVEEPAEKPVPVGDAPSKDELLAEIQGELARIKARNRLTSLADQAISAGSRYSYRELERAYQAPEIIELKDAASAEMGRVESHFVSTRRYRSYTLDVPRLIEGKRTESELDARDLIEIMLQESNYWEARARAAQLLATDKGDPRVAEALVRCIDGDSSLYVLQEALLSFEKITGYKPPGVFDGSLASDWWAQNKVRFAAKNPTAAGN